MANRKYANKAEYEAAMRKKHNEWNKANYRRLSVMIPPDLSDRLNRTAQEGNETKRQIVINAIEAYLKK